MDPEYKKIVKPRKRIKRHPQHSKTQTTPYQTKPIIPFRTPRKEGAGPGYGEGVEQEVAEDLVLVRVLLVLLLGLRVTRAARGARII